jgi:hypothetical protein
MVTDLQGVKPEKNQRLQITYHILSKNKNAIGEPIIVFEMCESTDSTDFKPSNANHRSRDEAVCGLWAVDRALNHSRLWQDSPRLS